MKLNANIIRVFAVMLFAALCFAQVPRQINYKGRLTDSEGVVFNGTYPITFKIFSLAEGGSPIWQEERSVLVTNGHFDVQLGELTSIDLPFDGPYWIELTVGGETLAPREMFSASPYAFRSIHADTAGYVAGSDNVLMSVSSEADRTGRYGHMMFVPSEGTEISESSPAHNDTIYIAIRKEGVVACEDPPATPGTVYGSTEVCSNARGIAYAVAPVDGATFLSLIHISEPTRPY